MDIMQVIKERRSYRSYLDQPVEDEKLKTILEAGQWAPSVMNLQPWQFYVVKNTDVKARIKAACRSYPYSTSQHLMYQYFTNLPTLTRHIYAALCKKPGLLQWGHMLNT